MGNFLTSQFRQRAPFLLKNPILEEAQLLKKVPKMKNSKWYVTGICLIGVVIGIVFVGVLTSAVHWAGTNKFCGEFCHSMDMVYLAYKDGLHGRTPTGVTAGCSDCHLKYHSNEHVGPIDYTLMLVDKVRAGSNSGWGEIRGTLNTVEKQIERREEMAKSVHELFLARDFSMCKGCHDLEKMHDPKKPMIATMHKNMGKDGKVVDCLACHPTAGHDYSKLPAPTKKE